MALIILDNSPSGTLYSPLYTLMSLHSSQAYFTEVFLINVGILDKVRIRLGKRREKLVRIFSKNWNDIKLMHKKKRDMQCKLPGIVGKKLAIISSHSFTLQSTWHSRTANLGDDNGKPETTRPTY